MPENKGWFLMQERILIQPSACDRNWTHHFFFSSTLEE